MNEDDKMIIAVRILGSLGGLACEAIGGTIIMVLLIIVNGSAFGFSTLWPGTLIGALIGILPGFFFPRIGKALAQVLDYIP
jgi:hypothetical protein